MTSEELKEIRDLFNKACPLDGVTEEQSLVWGKVPALLDEVDRLTAENEKIKPFYKVADDTFKHWENAAYAMRDEERARAEKAETQITALTARAEAAEAGRDAAVKDWKIYESDGQCAVCQYGEGGGCVYPEGGRCCFKWRGEE